MDAANHTASGGPGLADDEMSGSRYRLALVRGILCYQLVGGVAPITAVVVTYGPADQAVVALVGWWVVVVVATLVLWRVVKRRHLVRRRLTLAGLVAGGSCAAGLNVLATVMVPNSVQHSFGDVFWFVAQTNVAAWVLLRPALAPGAFLGLTGVAWLMVVVDPDRPSPPNVTAEAGFIAMHALWLALAVAVLVAAGRLIRLGSASALHDGVNLGRRVARLQALRETHDTVLQTLEAIALRAGDSPGDPAAELSAVSRLARAQAADLRRSLQGATDTGDDVHSMLVDLGQRFADRLDVEVDVLGSARLGHAPVEVWAALRGAVHECLTNVVKHSGAGRAFIEVERTSIAIHVVVRDDGCGFQPSRTTPGFGLAQSITQRLHEVGGRVAVSSVPGDGTTITLTAPLTRGVPPQGVAAPRTPAHRPAAGAS